ncbi:hypothetical protein HDU67_004706 [Dinochytrium kinnereticum]|nr:hypothetical protein HDU67_004706 [Dinochytrium kinnereticum]
MPFGVDGDPDFHRGGQSRFKEDASVDQDGQGCDKDDVTMAIGQNHLEYSHIFHPPEDKPFYFDARKSPDESTDYSYVSSNGPQELIRINNDQAVDYISENTHEDGNHNGYMSSTPRRDMRQYDNTFHHYIESNSDYAESPPMFMGTPRAMTRQGDESGKENAEDSRAQEDWDPKEHPFRYNFERHFKSRTESFHHAPPTHRTPTPPKPNQRHKKQIKRLTSRLNTATSFALHLGTLYQTHRRIQESHQVAVQELRNANVDLSLQVSMAEDTIRNLQSRIEEMSKELEGKTEQVLKLEGSVKRIEMVERELERRDEEERERVQEIERRAAEMKLKFEG